MQDSLVSSFSVYRVLTEQLSKAVSGVPPSCFCFRFDSLLFYSCLCFPPAAWKSVAHSARHSQEIDATIRGSPKAAAHEKSIPRLTQARRLREIVTAICGSSKPAVHERSTLPLPSPPPSAANASLPTYAHVINL